MSFSTFLHLDLNKMVAILQQSFSNAHYNDVIMGAIASQITSLTIVFSTVYSDADQRKYQSSASLAFVRGMHRGPVNSPHKWPVTRKMLSFDDVIMEEKILFVWNLRLVRDGSIIISAQLCTYAIQIYMYPTPDALMHHWLQSSNAWSPFRIRAFPTLIMVRDPMYRTFWLSEFTWPYSESENQF